MPILQTWRLGRETCPRPHSWLMAESRSAGRVIQSFTCQMCPGPRCRRDALLQLVAVGRGWGVQCLSSNVVPRQDLKKEKEKTSLVVQWLRLHTPDAGGPGSSPGRELDPPHN